MKKIFTTLAFSLVIATSMMAQSEECDVIFTGTPWFTMGISGNGRFIVGTRQYTEAYRYDIQEERLWVLPATSEYDDMCFSDVSDNGLVAGK
ncbi:MAG: T9SS C-terminal target domain-containing protein, partial [Bacteroidaceae bacterium]|nr:T9SS C-terminal target domain-containing protein [Bacteroidaceae bacterium]